MWDNMSQNIEIKASCSDHQSFLKLLDELEGARFNGKELQTDIFFKVKNGRLKLRKISDTKCVLIPYLRADKKGPTKSEYTLLEVNEPEKTIELLTTILGIDKCVYKERSIYLYENVRIHLDTVQDLGTFIEFEAVLSEGDNIDMEKEKVDQLLRYFDIKKKDLIADAYVDLLIKK
jgi:predicted adenylyl cyclase CyaB